MKVSELGQFGMIDLVSRMIEETRDSRSESWQNLIQGIGDDCAVWRGDSIDQLAKVDCQVQGIHFDLDHISWEDLGWKALAVNLSDIAAMGGIPRFALVSLGLPPYTEVSDVVSLYKGILRLAQLSGVAIAGGNLSGSSTVFIDVNVIGRIGNSFGKYLSRSSARPGDRIAVTGSLGTAAAGLEMLRQKLNFEDGVAACLKQAFVHPEPRLTEGRLLIEKGVQSGMDISDGLLSDLNHMCKASHTGAIIEVETLPIRPEVKTAFGERSIEMALSGGEDYQLLFTAKAAVIEKVRKASSYPVTVIGEMVEESTGQIILVDREGKRSLAQPSGWDHFKRR